MSDEKTEKELKEIAPPLEDKGNPGDTAHPREALAAGTDGRPAGQSSVKSPSWLAVAAVSVLISMAVSMGSIYVYDRFYAQKIVSVDIKGFIAQQKALYLAGKLTDAQFRANVDKMVAAVKAIPKNRMAIMGDAVIKNAQIEKLP